MVTWRELLKKELEKNNESYEDIISKVGSKENWEDDIFDNNYGLPHGSPFTVWTLNRVYFPVVYDGYEYVDSVSRNPNNKITYHIGRYL